MRSLSFNRSEALVCQEGLVLESDATAPKMTVTPGIVKPGAIQLGA